MTWLQCICFHVLLKGLAQLALLEKYNPKITVSLDFVGVEEKTFF